MTRPYSVQLSASYNNILKTALIMAPFNTVCQRAACPHFCFLRTSLDLDVLKNITWHNVIALNTISHYGRFSSKQLNF